MQNDTQNTKRTTPFQWLLFNLVMISLFTLFLWLGNWQLDREQQKLDLLAAIQQAPSIPLVLIDNNSPRFANVSGSGTYDEQHSFMLDNQVENGIVGVHLYTPLQTVKGEWLLVNRGWLPMQLDRRKLPEFSTPTGKVEINGRLNTPPQTGVRIGQNSSSSGVLKNTWPHLQTYLDLDYASAQLGYSLLPMVIQLSPRSASGYGARTPHLLNFGPEKHRGYAITWFTFALVAVILYFIILRIGRRDK